MAPPSNGAATEVYKAPTNEVSELMSEAGYDLSTSGLRFLSNEARVCSATCTRDLSCLQ